MLGKVKNSRLQARSTGFTLIELMVVMAVVAVVLVLAAPSFSRLMETQRVRGTSDQFLTDVQFARSEAASSQETTGISFKTQAGTQTCYTVHSCGAVLPIAICSCDCTLGAGNACPNQTGAIPPPRELRTVRLPTSDGVSLVPVLANGNPPVFPPAGITHINFDPATGALSVLYAPTLVVQAPPANGVFWAKVSSTRPGSTITVRDIVVTTGRPSACKPPGSTINGLPAC